MKNILLILATLIQLTISAQINSPVVIYKDGNTEVSEAFHNMIDFPQTKFINASEIHVVWTSRAALLFGKGVTTQQFSFLKVSFDSQEYFVFASKNLDSKPTDSILAFYKTIANLPSSRFIENWQPTTDGQLFQIESLNFKVDYQLRTFSGIQSNLNRNREAIFLNDFFELAERIISRNIEIQFPFSRKNFYPDHATGLLIPILTKEEFVELKNKPDLIIKKLPLTKAKANAH